MQKIIKLKEGDREFGFDAEIDKSTDICELGIWTDEQVEISNLSLSQIDDLISFLYSVQEEMRGE